MAESSSKGIVGICGSGLIGKGWAMLFASAGYTVNLFDLDQTQLKTALQDIQVQLLRLQNDTMLRGSRSVEEHLALIKGVDSLEACVKDAIYVQECIPERIEMKKDLFRKLDELVSSNTILASSSSSIAPSLFSAGLKNKANCIVNHPINPPYIIRLLEIVPAPWTSQETVARTKALMEELGQSPVTFAKEILGFGVNRIQLAILNECWHLVNDGILSAPDVDTLMTEGLGMRYAFQGPFETGHLLADGIGNSIRHFGPSFIQIGKTFKPLPSWEIEDSKKIIKELDEKVPLEQMTARRQWRDERLIALSKLKEEMRKREEL